MLSPLQPEPRTGGQTMGLQDYDTRERFMGTVVSSTLISPPGTDEVRELVVAMDDAPALSAGQSLGVIAPGQAEFGQKEHLRLYTVADRPERVDGRVQVRIAVKRCSYVDAYSGEEYPGRASNYLCDLGVGDRITFTGPYGYAFEVPPDPDATLILIGMGTGIAPFRAFVRHIFEDVPTFQGRVWLFHGGVSGLDLLYQNDERDDFAQYYDRPTFEAIKVLSSRPAWGVDADWGKAMGERAETLWALLQDPYTYVYVAGLESIRDSLDKAFAPIAGGADRWARRKAELQAGGRWVELVY